LDRVPGESTGINAKDFWGPDNPVCVSRLALATAPGGSACLTLLFIRVDSWLNLIFSEIV
jgi:hypothetical protein